MADRNGARGPKTFAVVCLMALVVFGVSMIRQSPFTYYTTPFGSAASSPGIVHFQFALDEQGVNQTDERLQLHDKGNSSNQTKAEQQRPSVPQPAKPKLILWDPVMYWLKVTGGSSEFADCPVNTCYLSLSRKEAEKMGTPDAVIISADHMGGAPPFQKAPGQVWVFTTHESPVTLREFGQNHWLRPAWKNMFDLTMTYRLDSDFPVPYDDPVKEDKEDTKDYEQILKKKTRMAAQISSHHCVCQSRRGDYIRLMQKHVPVDVYGGCGTNKCDQSTCVKMVSDTYRFYMSFENSLCSGYVTEKFLSYQTMDLVPVVRGNVDYSRFFPKDSYIDTRDFRSPKALADFLHYLQHNDTAYVRMLKAKANFRGTPRPEVFRKAYCQLCQYLHQPPPLTKPDFDFVKWWSEETTCKKPEDLIDE